MCLNYVVTRFVASEFLLVQRQVDLEIQQKLNLHVCNMMFSETIVPWFQLIVHEYQTGYWYLGEDFALSERARQTSKCAAPSASCMGNSSRCHGGRWSGEGCGGRLSTLLVRGLFNARRCVCLSVCQLLFEDCGMHIAVLVGHRERLHFVRLALLFERRIDPISGQQRAVVDTATGERTDAHKPRIPRVAACDGTA